MSSLRTFKQTPSVSFPLDFLPLGYAPPKYGMGHTAFEELKRLGIPLPERDLEGISKHSALYYAVGNPEEEMPLPAMENGLLCEELTFARLPNLMTFFFKELLRVGLVGKELDNVINFFYICEINSYAGVSPVDYLSGAAIIYVFC